MFIVGTAVIDRDIARERFSCDLPACKGGCCTLPGGRGAPLSDAEVGEIERAFDVIRPDLTVPGLRVIERRGLVEGSPGDFATPCVDERECAYVIFDGDIARCVFERAYLAGKIGWRKPLSCHLFPIRLRTFGQDMLHYERIEECSAGRSRGTREGTLLADFLRAALIRRYGQPWFEEFRSRCRDDSAPSL